MCHHLALIWNYLFILIPVKDCKPINLAFEISPAAEIFWLEVLTML